MEQTMKKERMTEQDIAKCLAICVVVATHTISYTKGFNFFIFSTIGFAMSFFFLMSGYNYRSGRGTYLSHIKKRAYQLLLPFILYTLGVFVVMTIYHVCRGEMEVGEMAKLLFCTIISKEGASLLGMKQMMPSIFGPSWFLQYMFTGCLVFFAVVDYALVNLKRFLSVVFALLITTAVAVGFNIELPWGIHAAPLVAAIMLLGAGFGKVKLLSTPSDKKIYMILNSIIAVGILALINFLYPNAGMFAGGMVGRVCGYWEVFLTAFVGMIGSYYLVNFCKLLKKLGWFSRLLIWIGQNTLPLLLIHLAVEAVVTDIVGAKDHVFGEMPKTIDWQRVFVFVLTMVICCLYIFLWNKLKGMIKQKLAAKNDNEA